MSRRAWLLFAALGLIWGVPYLLIRVAVLELHPLQVAFARTLVGALVLLPAAHHAGALRPAFQRWGSLLAFAAVEIAGPWLMLGYAETRLTSATAGLLIAVTPLITAILLSVRGEDRLSHRRWAGLAIGFAGVVGLVGLDVHVDDLAAVGAMALAALGYAIGPLIMSRRLADAPPLGVVTGSLLIATLIYAPVAPFVWSPIGHAAGASVVVLGVVCTAIAFLLFFALVAEAGPGRATVITYVNPAVALLLGAMVLHEPLTPGLAVGFPLILLGSLLATARQAAAPPRAADVRP